MESDSEFLHGLIGKPVRIVAVDESLPPLVLKEISKLGVVAGDAEAQHFFPWSEIVEITACRTPGADDRIPGELVEAALGVDSEP
jgi:hypothetical protein